MTQLATSFSSLVGGAADSLRDLVGSGPGTNDEEGRTMSSPLKEPNPLFVVDDSLSELQKCIRYVQSKLPLQRHVYAKRLCACARSVGVPATIGHILPVLGKLTRDTEVIVRQACADEAGQLALFLTGHEFPPDVRSSSSTPMATSVHGPCTLAPPLAAAETSQTDTGDRLLGTPETEEMAHTDEAGDAYRAVVDCIVPVIQRLIIDPNDEVKQSASRALEVLASVLTAQDVGKVVLTLVLCLAHDNCDEQRTTAVRLMHDLAPRLGRDLCELFVAQELKAFAGDSTFRVRKATAQSLGGVCAVTGADFTASSLLPCLDRLSHDLIWGVRRGCVDSVVETTRAAPPAARQEILLPLMLRFLSDNSRWVRHAALSELGPFIYEMGCEGVPKSLLASYTDIPADVRVNTQVKHSCAFNFPAVCIAMGVERWDELSVCFSRLVKYRDFTVRRCMAASLHHVAEVLGRELAGTAVTPVMNFFTTDIAEVQAVFLQNIAALLDALPPRCREEFLPYLMEVVRRRAQWRWRLSIASQLHELCRVFSPLLNALHITTMALTLIRDDVWTVRWEAVQQLGGLLQVLLRHDDSAANDQDPEEAKRTLKRARKEESKQDVLGKAYGKTRAFLHALATATAYRDRQLYIGLVSGLLFGPVRLPDPVLLRDFIPPLLLLCTDPCANTRIALARVLSKLSKEESPAERLPVDESMRRSNERLMQCAALVAVRKALLQDQDRDVVYIMGCGAQDSDAQHNSAREQQEQDTELRFILGEDTPESTQVDA